MKKIVFALFIGTLISCGKGVSEEKVSQFKAEITTWEKNSINLDKFNTELTTWLDEIKKEMADSLGDAGMKFLEKDSLSRARIKSLENEYNNLKSDYSNMLAGYQTFVTESNSWAENVNKSGQSSEEIETEWDAKKRQIEEINSQKEAYEQAFEGWKKSFRDAITEIKLKMNKK